MVGLSGGGECMSSETDSWPSGGKEGVRPTSLPGADTEVLGSLQGAWILWGWLSLASSGVGSGSQMFHEPFLLTTGAHGTPWHECHRGKELLMHQLVVVSNEASI